MPSLVRSKGTVASSGSCGQGVAALRNADGSLKPAVQKLVQAGAAVLGADLRIGEILLCQLGKADVKPVLGTQKFPFLAVEERFEPPASSPIVLIQFLSLAGDGCAPPSARPVQPGLSRGLSGHFWVSHGVGATATENPLRPARGTELSVPFSVPRVDLLMQATFCVNPSSCQETTCTNRGD
jgi:hypothetical protein